MEERIGKARPLMRRRGHRLETEEVEATKKKKSVGTRITDFSWRLQRPLKSPSAHFRKRKAIINKKRIINIVPPPPCDFELIELLAQQTRLKKKLVLLLET